MIIPEIGMQIEVIDGKFKGMTGKIVALSTHFLIFEFDNGADWHTVRKEQVIVISGLPTVESDTFLDLTKRFRDQAVSAPPIFVPNSEDTSLMDGNNVVIGPAVEENVRHHQWLDRAAAHIEIRDLGVIYDDEDPQGDLLSCGEEDAEEYEAWDGTAVEAEDTCWHCGYPESQCQCLRCDQCAERAGEEYGWGGKTRKTIYLTPFHGDYLCQDCLDWEMSELERDEKDGTVTFWNSKTQQLPEELLHSKESDARWCQECCEGAGDWLDGEVIEIRLYPDDRCLCQFCADRAGFIPEPQEWDEEEED